jgi:uncharacterized SAM-binding protein YcdF (DUF218 family)
MRDLFNTIINPLPVLYLLLLAGSVCFVLKKKKSGKILFVIAVFWFFIISTPFIPKIIVRSLEEKYTQVTETSLRATGDSSNILVLGSEHIDDRNLTPNNQLSAIALARLVEGVRIYRITSGSRLILSGYGRNSSLSHAHVLYQTAKMLGVDTSRMAIQPFPANTREEAEAYVKKFGTKHKLILVTSAVHMPRAVLLFRKAGADPLAAPANFLLKNGSKKNPGWWVPASANIAMMEGALHEKAGIMLSKIGLK